eukprot:TRINITY_DN1868_c0_g1_i2.p1 TRINITY_DN1868_c0_g1~~TRINITY_DN1868_c0_g1_i2.p1  ORF type:complete len:587 (+),score=134.29 TRINITY_DN1868_c0_g1_i2:167-1927(+)
MEAQNNTQPGESEKPVAAEEKRDNDANGVADKRKDWGFDKEANMRYFNILHEDNTEFIEVLDHTIVSLLAEETRSESWFGRRPKATVLELYDTLPLLRRLASDTGKSSIGDVKGLQLLVAYIDETFDELTAKLDDMQTKGVVSFEGLRYLFRKNVKAFMLDRALEQKIAFRITQAQYVRRFDETYFKVTGHLIRSNGKKFMRCIQECAIASYQGVKKLSELPIQIVDDEVMQELTKRGQLFKQYGIGNHYLMYQGNMFQTSMWQTILFKATGRVMVDGSSFRQFNPNYPRPAEADRQLSGFSDDELWCAYPFLEGFSFFAKKWGEISISDLTPISFDDTAFDKLVIPQDKKTLISALVRFQDKAFTDIISGKGGGCIFLLHGSPGVGKTLTAESIAELMHRPLYSISVGELGTTPELLEKTLSNILQLASIWKAVILLDEADIFLEKRSENDIVRNAMVGVFLRLLEYHQGVLFLTTNRVKNFDPAFHSRISVALRYHDLDADSREKIWKNLLQAADIQNVNPKDFRNYDINGRQIKNSIRLAQALAASEGREISKEFLETTIEVARQFQTDLLDSIAVQEAKEGI